MADNELKDLIVITTIIFLIMPAFLLVYIAVYNKRKKKHSEEKIQIKQAFEEELIKTQHEIREHTMQTIGTDLHDNIGQLLSLTSLTLKSITPAQPAKIMDKVDTAVDLLSKSIKEMRLLGKLLQGDQLIAEGLDEAIKQAIKWIRKSEQFEIDYQYNVPLVLIKNPSKDLVFFRILQEILNNIIKHAMATAIQIALKYAGDTLILYVKDNGIGISQNEQTFDQLGMGLHNIKKRATLIGGNVVIDSQAGKGTQLTISIPYP